MKIIKIRHPYQADQIPPEDVVLVLGFFDGVHLGHQRVINRGKEIAKKEGLKLALMTFIFIPHSSTLCLVLIYFFLLDLAGKYLLLCLGKKVRSLLSAFLLS